MPTSASIRYGVYGMNPRDALLLTGMIRSVAKTRNIETDLVDPEHAGVLFHSDSGPGTRRANVRYIRVAATGINSATAGSALALTRAGIVEFFCGLVANRSAKATAPTAATLFESLMSGREHLVYRVSESQAVLLYLRQRQYALPARPTDQRPEKLACEYVALAGEVADQFPAQAENWPRFPIEPLLWEVGMASGSGDLLPALADAGRNWQLQSWPYLLSRTPQLVPIAAALRERPHGVAELRSRFPNDPAAVIRLLNACALCGFLKESSTPNGKPPIRLFHGVREAIRLTRSALGLAG